MNEKNGNFKKFILLWTGALISSIGSGITSFGLSVYVFNTTGSAASMSIVTLLAFVPTLLFSVPAVGAKFSMPLFDVYKKELKIFGSFVNPDTHEDAVQLLNSGRIQTAPLITHTFPLEKLEDAIHMQMSAESIKVQVVNF